MGARLSVSLKVTPNGKEGACFTGGMRCPLWALRPTFPSSRFAHTLGYPFCRGCSSERGGKKSIVAAPQHVENAEAKRSILPQCFPSALSSETSARGSNTEEKGIWVCVNGEGGEKLLLSMTQSIHLELPHPSTGPSTDLLVQPCGTWSVVFAPSVVAPPSKQ